jgi:hypothetical protein
VKSLLACMAALALSTAAIADATTGRTFSVSEAKRAFYAQTGMRLVTFRDASTPDATSLRTRPYDTKRFGTFQLFVLNPRKLEHMRRVFTHGVKRDRHGIHWVPDQAGGFIAVTVYQRNLLVAWFPPGGSRGIDSSWTRLDGVVRRIAPRAY